MAHLMWACDATTLCTAHLRRPAHRGEERLLAATYRRLTPSQLTDGTTLGHEIQSIVNLIAGTFQDGHDHIAIATDGGADHSLAAWSAATTHGSVAGPLRGEDTSSMAAELGAIYRALRAIEAFVHCPLPVSSAGSRSASSLAFCIVFDSTSAAGLASGSGPLPGDRSLLAATLRTICSRIVHTGASVSWQWIPSHDKVSARWRLTSFVPEPLCRSLNRAADTAATLALRAQHSSPRHCDDLDRAAAKAWSAQALDTAVGIYRRYSAFVLNAPPRAQADIDDDAPLVQP